MAPIKLESISKEVELKPFTRAIARVVNEELLKDVIVRNGVDGAETDIPAINADRSEEAAIKMISGLSQEDMDNLSIPDYEKLKTALNTAQGKKK